MKIHKIILYRYRRLFLNNIEKLEYTPEAPVQVIIGRNMCGKSSLLKELTPLPAEVKKEFKDGGYKEIHIDHNGSSYILISKIEDGKVSHSFLKDNQELNDGRTKKVQLELVKTYFNLTPDIVDILLNKNRFTTMSPFERKRWFSEMSSIDYTYPISVYTKIKTRHRDIVGGIKLATDNVVSTESKIENNNLMEKYIKDKEILEEIKNHLNSLYVLSDVNNNVSPEEIFNKLNIEINNMENLLRLPMESNLNKDDVNKLIESSKIKLDHIVKEIESTNKELDLIEASNKYGDIKEIETKEIAPLVDKLNKLKEDINYHIGKDNIYMVKGELLENDYLLFSNIIQDIISNINMLSPFDYLKDLDKNGIEKIKRDKEHNSSKINITNLQIKLVNEEKEKMINIRDNGKNISCPNCNFNFLPNYDPKVIEDCDNKIIKYNKELKEYEDKEIKLNKLVDDITIRLKLLENIASIMRGNPSLKYIWLTILETIDLKTSNSETMLATFNKYFVLMSNWKEITRLNIQLTEIKKKIEFLKEVEKTNISLEKSRLEILNKKLFELQSNKKLLEETIFKNGKYLKILESISNRYHSLFKSISMFKSDMEKVVVNIRNKYLIELIDKIKDDIIKLDNEIFKFKSGKDQIANEKKKIEEYKVKEKVLKILEKELSPTEGLIAKSINSFLNIFVEEMNEVISNIWTYDIQLLPCDIDNENGYDLDYKFRVKVDGNETIEDVNKLSSSGQEIVDLAYRLVFAKYMGLETIPLMLDEFGSSFDKSHRTKAYEVIDRILGSEYGQIFLICHFESLYGTLRNMDVNILDPNNIELGYVTEKNSKFKIN